jgi:hypothetical protein
MGTVAQDLLLPLLLLGADVAVVVAVTIRSEIVLGAACSPQCVLLSTLAEEALR